MCVLGSIHFPDSFFTKFCCFSPSCFVELQKLQTANLELLQFIRLDARINQSASQHAPPMWQSKPLQLKKRFFSKKWTSHPCSLLQFAHYFHLQTFEKQNAKVSQPFVMCFLPQLHQANVSEQLQVIILPIISNRKLGVLLIISLEFPTVKWEQAPNYQLTVFQHAKNESSNSLPSAHKECLQWL